MSSHEGRTPGAGDLRVPRLGVGTNASGQRRADREALAGQAPVCAASPASSAGATRRLSRPCSSSSRRSARATRRRLPKSRRAGCSSRSSPCPTVLFSLRRCDHEDRHHRLGKRGADARQEARRGRARRDRQLARHHQGQGKLPGATALTRRLGRRGAGPGSARRPQAVSPKRPPPANSSSTPPPVAAHSKHCRRRVPRTCAARSSSTSRTRSTSRRACRRS